jgi:hypothetical protein
VEGQRADGPGELSDRPAPAALLEAGDVAAQLVGPRRGLEPEGHRRPGLTVGPAGDRGVPMPRGELEDPGLEGADVAAHQVGDVAHHGPEPGVGEVLDGGADVDVLPGRDREDRLQTPDQPEGGVGGRAGRGRDLVEVQALDPGARGDLFGGRGRNDARAGLYAGECDEDVQPGLPTRLLPEQVDELGGGPQVGVDG